MKHGHEGFMTGSFLPDMVIILGIITLLAGVIYLTHRKKLASDGLTSVERKNLNYPEDEILSMVRQHGGPIAQSDLVDTLPGDMDELVEAINGLEEKGLVQRIWLKEQGTYTVFTRPVRV